MRFPPVIGLWGNEWGELTVDVEQGVGLAEVDGCVSVVEGHAAEFGAVVALFEGVGQRGHGRPRRVGTGPGALRRGHVALIGRRRHIHLACNTTFIHIQFQ